MKRWQIVCLRQISVILMILLTFAVSMAQDTGQVAPLVPITADNAKQLEQWIPLDENSSPAQAWIPMARGTLQAVQLSPDESLLVTGSASGLYLMDMNNLSQQPIRVEDINHPVNGIYFSPDGGKIVVQTSNNRIYTYDIETHDVKRISFPQEIDRFSNLQFDAEGVLFIAAYTFDTYYVISWDVQTGIRIAIEELPQISKFLADNRRVSTIDLVVTPDSYITSHPLEVSFSNTTEVVDIWDRDTLDLQQTLKLTAEASDFSVVADGTLFVTSGYGNGYDGALFWNASTGGLMKRIATAGRYYLSPDQTQIWFSKSDSNQITVWDVETQQQINAFEFESDMRVNQIAEHYVVSSDSSGNIHLWQYDDSSFSKRDVISAFSGYTNDIIFNSAGQLMIRMGSNTVDMWDTTSWSIENTLHFDRGIRRIELSPDEQTLALATSVLGDNYLQLHDLQTGNLLASASYDYPFYGLAFDPDGEILATGRQRGFDVAIYSTTSATMLYRFREDGIPYALAFNPEGTLLASGNADSKLRVYDMETSQTEYVVDIGGRIYSLAFNPSGDMLAVGTKVLSFFDVATGEEIYKSDYLGTDINSMAFSPDGSLLVTVREEALEVWGVKSHKLLFDADIISRVPRVAFHPDGNIIAVSSYGVSLWVVNTGADSDDDGVDDIRDSCPVVAGEINGCPDSDGDGVTDNADLCPAESGTANGCPDEDGDGVGDAEDMCPAEIGSLAARGCPDRDNDGIIDNEDTCPAVSGLSEFGGCPDTDGDTITDADDACPAYYGLADNDGCPSIGNTNTNANIRSLPSTNGAIVRSIPPSDEFYIIGRNTAGDWLQIVLDFDEEATTAWVFSSLVVTDVDVMSLPVHGD